MSKYIEINVKKNLLLIYFRPNGQFVQMTTVKVVLNDLDDDCRALER